MADHSAVAEAGATGDQEPAEGRTPRRAWLLAFLGFFLFIGAWSLAAPYDGTPDEQEHVLRAAGVAAGQVVLTPASVVRGAGAYVTVPESLIRENCWRFKPTESAACATEPGGPATPRRTGTGAGRYNPLYYAVVGAPLGILPNWTGILLARLIGAALAAALLAGALLDAMRWSRFRLVAVGVLVAVTPIAAQMASAVNPNGIEIAAGVAFFAAAVPLLFSPGAGRSKTLLWHAGVAALALAALRVAGPLLLTVAVVALLLPLRWARLRDLWRWRELRLWFAGVAAMVVASVAWSVVMRTADAGTFGNTQRWTLTQATLEEIERLQRYADEMVGVMAWLDARMPTPVYLVWQYAAAALIIGGFVLSRRAGRIRLAALLLGGLGVPAVLEIAFVNEAGLITQGRYLLPVLVGLPILAAFEIQRYGLAEDKSRSLTRLYLILLLPIQFVCLVYTMGRWQHGQQSPRGGLGPLNPLSGAWQPPLGPVVPLVACVAGLALIGALLWRDDRVTGDDPGARIR